MEKSQGFDSDEGTPKADGTEAVLVEKQYAKEGAGNQVHSFWSGPRNVNVRSACCTLRRKQTGACAENE